MNLKALNYFIRATALILVLPDIIFDVSASDPSNLASIFIKQINVIKARGNWKQLFRLNSSGSPEVLDLSQSSLRTRPRDVSRGRPSMCVAQCAIYIFSARDLSFWFSRFEFRTPGRSV